MTMLAHYLMTCHQQYSTKIDKSPSSTPHGRNVGAPESGDARATDSEDDVSEHDISDEKILHDDSHMISEVMSQLEKLIINDDWVYQGKNAAAIRPKKTTLPRLDEVARSVVTSYSLKAYIELLQPGHRAAIANWLYHNTATVLCKLLRTDSTLYFHEDKLAGILRVLKVALHSAIPDLNQRNNTVKADPEAAVAEQHPAVSVQSCVVYMSPNLSYSQLQKYLAFELLFLELKPIPSTRDVLGFETLDLKKFEDMIEEDLSQHKIPLAVLASAGSTLNGKCDQLAALMTLKERFRFWLHFDGLELASLFLDNMPEALKKVPENVDSMFLPLASWLSTPAVPFITVHRPLAAFAPTQAERIASLPWWVVTRHLNTEGIRNRINTVQEASMAVLKMFMSKKQLDVIAYGCSAREEPDKVRKLYSQSKVPTVVLVKYAYRTAAADQNGAVSVVDDKYVDSINSWLGQGLSQDCSKFGFHIVATRDLGTCVRFCGLEYANASDITVEDLKTLDAHFESSIQILDATVVAKCQLTDVLAKDYPNLIVARVSKWAGVGAVIYVPSMLHDQNDQAISMNEWNEKQRQQVSHLNIELVHVLRANDSAFSLGESDTGISCVKFGMLADAGDLNNLILMVSDVGKHIEESSRYIESLAELVKQGIGAAEQDLKKESENKLIQEGVMRQVPIFGSIWNWLAPLPKDTSVAKGRSFDLISGKILNSDAVYKHKVQLARENGSIEEVDGVVVEGPQSPSNSSDATTSDVSSEHVGVVTEEHGDTSRSVSDQYSKPDTELAKEVIEEGKA